MSRALFRQEVVDVRRGIWPGTIVIAAPLSRWLPITLSTALAIAIVLFPLFRSLHQCSP